MWQCSDATWWPTLEAMQMALADDQILNQCKLCHLGTQFATDASGASWWQNLQSVQVAPSGFTQKRVPFAIEFSRKLVN